MQLPEIYRNYNMDYLLVAQYYIDYSNHYSVINIYISEETLYAHMSICRKQFHKYKLNYLKINCTKFCFKIPRQAGMKRGQN